MYNSSNCAQLANVARSLHATSNTCSSPSVCLIGGKGDRMMGGRQNEVILHRWQLGM